MKYKLELTQKQIEVLGATLYGAWFDLQVEDGEWRSKEAVRESKILANILQKIAAVR